MDQWLTQFKGSVNNCYKNIAKVTFKLVLKITSLYYIYI